MLQNSTQSNEIPKDQPSLDASNKQWVNDEHESQVVVGIVTNFISHKQKSCRQLSQFEINSTEHPLWQPIACHSRNKQYTNKTTRSIQTLKQCLNFIIKQYMPILAAQFSDHTKRIRLLDFIYNRIICIRCEYFVQEIFQPLQMHKIIRILILLETLIEKPLRIVGLQQFLDKKNMNILKSSQQNYRAYKDCLKIALQWVNQHQFSNILTNHYNQIEDDQQIQKTIKKCKNIFNKNYYIYFRTLASQKTDIIHRCVLWSKIDKIRQLYKNLMIAANMDQKMPYICKVFGLKKKQGWINLRTQNNKNKNATLQQLKGNFDLPIKLWISESNILQCCVNFIGSWQKIVMVE